LRQFDRFHSIVGTCTGDHGNATSCNLNANLNDALVLVMRQGRCFTSRADWDEPFGAFFDLPVYKCAKGFLVERSFGIEWRDKRISELLKKERLDLIPPISLGSPWGF